MLGEYFSSHISSSFGPESTKSWLELDLKKILCLCVCLGFSWRRNLYICVPAAHPPVGAWGEDSVGEGRQRAGGGSGGQALQHTLPGERFTQRSSVHRSGSVRCILCCIRLDKSEFDFIARWAVCHRDEDYPQQISEKWRLKLAAADCFYCTV